MVEAPTIIERHGLGLATVMARKGFDGSVEDLVLPAGPRSILYDGVSFIGMGPGVWLALSEAPGADWPEPLERGLAGRCSIADQSGGGYVVLRLQGAGAGPLLQRGVAIDLHPDVFTAGSAATAVIAHIGVTLWRPGEGPDFDVAVFRSYAASFRQWLNAQSL